MAQPQVKTDIEARVQDIGDTMTGVLHIDAELGLITGSSTQTAYSGMQATRLCASDENNVNTAGFIIDSSGQAKFLHRRGDRSFVEDAYFLFNGEGYSFYANGEKGGTPVNSTPVFQALQSANRPTFKGQELALTKDIDRAYILGNDNDTSGTWFKLASVQLNSTYRHYRLFFTASETDSGNSPTELCIYVSTNNVDTAVGKSITVMSQKYDEVLLNNLYILISADTYTSGSTITAEIWFYKSSRYSSYTINNIYEMSRNNPNPYHWTFNEGNTQTPLTEPTSGYSQYKAIDILNGHSVGSSARPIYLDKNIPKSCSTPVGGAWWNGVPYVTSGGVMELGKYLDFHTTNTTTSNYSVRIQSVSDGGTILDLPSTTGVLLNSNIASSTAKRYIMGVSAIGSTATSVAVNAHASIYTQSGVLYGAAWNDYAEFRESAVPVQAGRCVKELGNGKLQQTQSRLEPGCLIVSDTFGYAIGQTEICQTPIAVSGRVLAYPAEDRYSYSPGDAVCSGPNGTVSKMTRKEIMFYPERIIGTVSEIPEYETWGEGNVPVDDRIWIKVK